MRGAKARRSRAAAEPRRFRSLDSTGNVRLLTPEDAARIAAAELATAGPATPEPTTAGPATAGPATAGPTTVEPPAAGPATLEPPAAGPADLATPAARRQTAPANLEPSAALPIAAYDALSLPSLRSRLRSLDAGQLQVLLDYERSNARRNDVMGMFERRITKLGTASSDAT